MTTDFTLEELQSATRNHGMPLEALAYTTTPVGMHYVLTHFDTPRVDPEAWRLEVDGRVARALCLSLEEVRSRPRVSQQVTLECAGNGRARLTPRPRSQPWLDEAVGTGEWTGTPLGPLLQEAGLLDEAREVLFTGLDRGEQGEIVQWYQRALSAADSLRPEVLLAYEMNGVPLPPQHGFPLRLIVPGWYGMTQVKWLHRITVLDQPFWGYQQNVFYRIARDEDDPGVQLTRMYPRALMVPPGIPVFETRERLLSLGHQRLQGRAWSGWGGIIRVEVSTDAGQHWQLAALEPPAAPHAWQAWSLDWEAGEGRHELLCRATDAAGNAQPLEPQWNLKGVANNAVQRLVVQVRRDLDSSS
ncbi:sulfite oxidase [Halomonas nitroreducens]|uniref:Sulfite oxidase n=1 Tax=Halomonas nitroreducens TaxID=447425 RepID=A0A3S0KTP0_9GAMM|nr:sulfite oxidase [Halomonas nitroreducens]RTR07060.1 sulfite oxidase [Halomonas nitroreducens]